MLYFWRMRKNGFFTVFGNQKNVKKCLFFLSIGKDVEFHLFAKKLFSTPKLWKMWKTQRLMGWKSPENRENTKSYPHCFPHFPQDFVGNFQKMKNVRFAQIFLLLEESWQKKTVKNWYFRRKNYPETEKSGVKEIYLFSPWACADRQRRCSSKVRETGQYPPS